MKITFQTLLSKGKSNAIYTSLFQKVAGCLMTFTHTHWCVKDKICVIISLDYL